MIRAAICDDDVSVLNGMREFIDRYCMERNREIVHTCFHSPLDLMAKIEQGARFDILFLDILMPGQNGIETAREIRRYDGNVKIIFLTSSTEFAVESYTVEAFFYQLKPLRWDAFSRVMDSALEQCGQEQENSLVLRCKGAITRLNLARLEFCEVINRTLLFHLASGKVLESAGSMDELDRQLQPYGCFLRVHRSYIINLNYVRTLTNRAVTMTCLTEIPIPRGKYTEIKDTFLEYAFRNGQVSL